MKSPELGAAPEQWREYITGIDNARLAIEQNKVSTRLSQTQSVWEHHNLGIVDYLMRKEIVARFAKVIKRKEVCHA